MKDRPTILEVLDAMRKPAPNDVSGIVWTQAEVDRLLASHANMIEEVLKSEGKL